MMLAQKKGNQFMRTKLILILSMMMFILTGCKGSSSDSTDTTEKTAITFADVGWDSIKLNNALAGLVAETVFNYTWQETPGSTPISHEALVKGEIDVQMEEWTDNIPSYSSDLSEGKFTELGVNFDDNYQGLYIPQYVADQYPELKSVSDLAEYAFLFTDPEDSSKGIIYGGVTGWEITEIMGKKVKAYGLDEYYNYFESGSDAVLSAAMTSAWDKKEPIVAYYWEPTWLLGKYDFVLLEDSPYDAEKYTEGYGACPAVTVTIAVSNDFAASNPEYCEFLSKFKMSSELIGEALAYMNDTKANYNETAQWLLSEAHPELIDQWLTAEQAKLLKKAL